MKSTITLLCLTLLSCFHWTETAASEDDYVDFSDQATSFCEIKGLVATPPEDWFNVPIETGSAKIRGCQMMHKGDQDELIGIMRLLSFEIPENQETPNWSETLVGFERIAIAEMGYSMGQTIWVRESVPISAEDLYNAQAIGFSASIEGNDIPQEAHFLMFEGQALRYSVTLLTPAKSVDKGIYYKTNTQDFGELISTLTKKTN